MVVVVFIGQLMMDISKPVIAKVKSHCKPLLKFTKQILYIFCILKIDIHI